MFSSEYCKVLKNSFFAERLRWLLLLIKKKWENDLLNFKSSNSEIKLFWKFTKKHSRSCFAWTFCTFRSSYLYSYSQKNIYQKTLAALWTICILWTISALFWTMKRDFGEFEYMDDFNITNFLIAEAATARDYFVCWIVKGTRQ